MLEEVGVSASPALYLQMREPDVEFVHPLATIDQVLELLRITAPRFAFVYLHFFDPQLAARGQDRDVPEVVEMLDRARAYEGDLFRVDVTWMAGGVISTWSAFVDWYDTLLEDAEIATEAAKGIREIDLDARRQRSGELFARLRTLIMADTGFRKATVNKRTTIAKLLIAAQAERFEDPWLENRLLQDLRQEATIEVTLQEQQHEDEIENLAAQIVASNYWVNVGTQSKQKAAIAAFMLDVSDGWMLTESFLSRVRSAVLDIVAPHRHGG
ncbi:hypothetical protein BO218_00465 [Microbacterium paludicola]|nr:hypothetical protein BO218_00465 [Microbacterium paludicola]